MRHTLIGSLLAKLVCLAATLANTLRATVAFTLLAIGTVASTTGAAQAAELVMVEEHGCVFCAKFDRQIAPAYPKTAEGKQAPLRRVQLGDPWPDDLRFLGPALYTPTFILVDNGQEVDRLTGYPGDEHFWFLLNSMLEKL